MNNEFTICIGSNIEDGRRVINDALIVLSSLIVLSAKSEIYRMPSYNGVGNDYYNMVFVGKTSLTFEELTAETKRVEILFGRTADSKLKGIVPLDIDIVYWNSDVVRLDEAKRQYFTYGLDNCR